MKRLLITGAAGGLGGVMRTRLSHLADVIRISDVSNLGEAGPNEELVQCDLGDKDAVSTMVEGCDGIVHFGGISVEETWEKIRVSNIDGIYNLYEAARAHNRPRILFASSNHTIGFHKQTDRLDVASVTKPDSLYGVSKCFGEAMASMYFDKFGIETASLRIGSCLPEPNNHRALSTWLSYDDFVRLAERVFTIAHLGCPVIYGASDNDASWWDNSAVSYLGWKPQDKAEEFREKVDTQVPLPAPDAPEVVYQGGIFTAVSAHKGSDD